MVALGKKMGEFTGYPVSTGDGGVGYFAPGATDDWLYGTRGVPAYTFEIGPPSGACGGLPAGVLVHVVDLLAGAETGVGVCGPGCGGAVREAAVITSG